MSEQRFAYAGICPGCEVAVAITSDRPERKRDVATCVAEWIRDGLRVERMPSEQARERFNECQCAHKNVSHFGEHAGEWVTLP